MLDLAELLTPCGPTPRVDVRAAFRRLEHLRETADELRGDSADFPPPDFRAFVEEFGEELSQLETLRANLRGSGADFAFEDASGYWFPRVLIRADCFEEHARGQCPAGVDFPHFLEVFRDEHSTAEFFGAVYLF